MALRFAILKVLETKVGNYLENVVYEHDEKRVYEDLLENIMDSLPPQEKGWFGTKGWTKEDFEQAFKDGWKKTVTAFKKVTIRIL